MRITDPRIEKDERTGGRTARWSEDGQRKSKYLGHKSQKTLVNTNFKRLCDELKAKALGVISGAGEAAWDTFEAWLEDKEANGHAAYRTELLLSELRPFFLEFKIETLADITADKMREYKQWLANREYSPTTIRGRLSTLRAFLNWCVQAGKLSANPFPKKFLPKAVYIPRFYELGEMSALLGQCTGDLLAMVRFAYDCGLRQGEVLAIEGRHITFANDKEAVLTVPLTKTESPRTVPLSDELIALMSRYAGKRDRLFEGWDKDKLYYHFKEALKRAGVKDRVVQYRGKEMLIPATFHALRHTFCKEYLEAGGTIRDLMLWTGHKSLAMMEIYAHFQKSYLNERLKAVRLRRAETTGKLPEVRNTTGNPLANHEKSPLIMTDVNRVQPNEIDSETVRNYGKNGDELHTTVGR